MEQISFKNYILGGYLTQVLEEAADDAGIYFWDLVAELVRRQLHSSADLPTAEIARQAASDFAYYCRMGANAPHASQDAPGATPEGDPLPR